MNKIVLNVIIGLFLTIHLSAGEMTKLLDIAAFEKRLTKETETVDAIRSDFTQQKYIDVFDETIVSEGKFYYQKSNKIRMEYFTPMDYLIVINDTKLKIVSDGKKSIMNLEANKMMSQMQDMLTACMVGNLSAISNSYELEYFEDTKYYLVKIKPLNELIRSYINQIEIYLDKADMTVHRLRLSETETNYTEYQFYNKKYNLSENEDLFAVR